MILGLNVHKNAKNTIILSLSLSVTNYAYVYVREPQSNVNLVSMLAVEIARVQ